MSKELYEQYLSVKGSGSIEKRIETLTELMRLEPKVIDYIENKVDSCYGTHIVYIVLLKVDGQLIIKAGYTKNDVVTRLSEKRYAGRHNLEIVEVLREEKFQAKGAKDFEKHLKSLIKQFNVITDLTLPGKGELYKYENLDVILDIYDANFANYKEVYGLKSPN